jgi:hypothetical protein
MVDTVTPNTNLKLPPKIVIRGQGRNHFLNMQFSDIVR